MTVNPLYVGIFRNRILTTGDGEVNDRAQQQFVANLPYYRSEGAVRQGTPYDSGQELGLSNRENFTDALIQTMVVSLCVLPLMKVTQIDDAL